MAKMTAAERASELRSIPQVDRLSGALPQATAATVRVAAARRAIALATESILAGEPAPSFDSLVETASRLLDAQRRRRLGPVINATGVLLHTNLGRAPLSDDALRAVRQVGSGYSNLEFDLSKGKRGSRYEHSTEMLAALTGAESALVVNNNAAAVLLALAGLARGKEAIISRGELIEIGGEFRIPEIMAESGALMREVGTTNRTHLSDYRNAVTAETGAILKVHPSNYEVTGFTASVPGRELAELAHANGIPLISDIGSGLISRQLPGGAPPWLGKEPAVVEAVDEGADIVTFSGDKLLGGPQAGVLVGRAGAVGKLRRSPLLRAFRTDKTTLAALDSTLAAYLDGEVTRIPFWRMALMPAAEVEARARSLAAGLPDTDATLEVMPGFSTTGGGSAPSSRIPTALLRVQPSRGAQGLAGALLAHEPPVVARIEDGCLILDLRTVHPDDDPAVAAALGDALKEAQPPS
ncbi:MAG TPA: L-seryl-tRNA(Sec) selenium transferase [Actinomycetota bacterium]|nr:L-seryl-tRNA(Sec) selenium transferase [Actinomycetota bacterium]